MSSVRVQRLLYIYDNTSMYFTFLLTIVGGKKTPYEFCFYCISLSILLTHSQCWITSMRELFKKSMKEAGAPAPLWIGALMILQIRKSKRDKILKF